MPNSKGRGFPDHSIDPLPMVSARNISHRVGSDVKKWSREGSQLWEVAPLPAQGALAFYLAHEHSPNSIER